MTDEAIFVKFLRFFTSRLVQTLVQARLGLKIEQECSGKPGQTDWFNTKVDELGEIAAYLRSAIDEYPPECDAVTIEFLLYTADGVHLPLESWVISVDDDECDQGVNINTEFYHRLGTILRSASGAARMTPMYRYFVKRQSQDTFVILYRIYKGTMDADLGKEAKHISIAVLPSPFGTLNLDLSYRTNMSSPVKEDEKTDPSTSDIRKMDERLPCRPSFSDCTPVIGGNAEESQSVTSPNFKACSAQTPTITPSQPRFRIGRSSSSEESTQSLHLSSSLDTKDCAFAPHRPYMKRQDSIPFEQLLASSMSPTKRQSSCSETSEPIIGKSLPEIKEIPSLEIPSTSTNMEKSAGDEEEDQAYVRFTSFSDNSAALSKLIKDCRAAPNNLDGFSGDETLSLADQLQQFTAQERDFAEFVRAVHDHSS